MDSFIITFTMNHPLIIRIRTVIRFQVFVNFSTQSSGSQSVNKSMYTGGSYLQGGEVVFFNYEK